MAADVQMYSLSASGCLCSFHSNLWLPVFHQWDMVITLAYDNCLRVFDAETRSLLHCWENENHVQFTGFDVDLKRKEVGEWALVSSYPISGGC